MANIAKNLEITVASTPSKAALIFNDKVSSYQEINSAANQIANLLNQIGIEEGDNVALSCPNLPYFPAIYYAILKVGAVVVPLNVLLKKEEVTYHLKDSKAKAYFCFEGTETLPMGAIGAEAFNDVTECMTFIQFGENSPLVNNGIHLDRIIANYSNRYNAVAKKPNDTAVILYTSGTTGEPKGAELSHGNIQSNLSTSKEILTLTSSDVILATLPLFHSFGQTVLMNSAISCGASLVLIPQFNPAIVLKAMANYQVSLFAGVPTMYIALLNAPCQQQYNIKPFLRLAVAGGSPLPVEIIHQFEERYDTLILEGYGLSETSPIASFNHADKQRLPGSVGQPIKDVSIKIVDSQGRKQPQGEPGEILVKGPNVMKGYYQREEATNEAIKEGWFSTGDIGYFDEQGNLFIVDRIKEMIIRGGFNVYPREIEETLITHPQVLMAAVIGVTDPVMGEEIRAYIVPKDESLTEDNLLLWAKERIANYKYPRQIEFVETLPMTSTGKILKRKLLR